ncbi:MAG: N-acetylmuramoyl-L-alanine amidase [Phaeodactylibacter sp.]|nr:N-acetylmuramoyl-L-alanine amidase [Phaeodactylibacter sp.]MCB9049263.1 N-acetylmuramoyl-L-alanine amidase [Lewinellaceae bacterium]
MLAVAENLINSPRRPNRKLKTLKGIVLHWTANKNPGAGAVKHWEYFNSFNDGRRASAHYLVDAENIIRCVPDDEVAFHVGAKRPQYTPLALEIMEASRDSPNNYLIGIELCVNADNDLVKTRQKGAELTMRLMEQYGLGIHQVHRHLDITGKDCPQLVINGKDENDWQAFLQEVESFRAPAPQPVEEPAVEEPAPVPVVQGPIAADPIVPANRPVEKGKKPSAPARKKPSAPARKRGLGKGK